MTAHRRAAFWGAATLAVPAPAAAHLASTGMGPAYDGAWHLLLAPAQIAVLAAAALFAGRRGPDAARGSLLVATPVWLLAWWAAAWLPPALGAVAGSCAMLAAGLLLAADAPLGPHGTQAATALLTAAAGAGYDSPFAPTTAAGAAATLFAIFALASSVSLPMRRHAALVAVRVAGSWTAALGLLLLGWWVRGRAA